MIFVNRRNRGWFKNYHNIKMQFVEFMKKAVK
jgi:hypothetical protein